MRPTGPLHFGHYFGALSNWLKLQDEYDCFFFVADWHALTTDYSDALKIRDNTLEIAIDWLAAGLDPGRCTMFLQSAVAEHAELHLLLSMITPLSWLERVPTYKEQIEQLRDRDLGTYGFLGYPLLQAADIVMYGDPRRDLLVPVGEDQVPHVELTREIVRRFTAQFGLQVKDALFEVGNRQDLWAVWKKCGDPHLAPSPDTTLLEADRSMIRTRIRDHAAMGGVDNFLENTGSLKKYFLKRRVLCEPEAMITETPRIPGTDGRKMSKTYNNYISLSESDDSIRAKTRVMMTDPARKRREDPGNPDVCPVFSWHKLFSPPERIAWADAGCRTADIGCIECKEAMAEGLIRWIEPIRARRQEYEAEPGRVSEILQAGSNKARKVARQTMRRVRAAVFGRDLGKAAGKSTAIPKLREAATGS
jgi:tryptophanyl-tRNA synthetase